MRTSKQLHRTHVKLIEKYNKLSLLREHERRQNVNGSDGRTNKVDLEKPIYHNVEEAIIQLKYRLYQNYCVVQRVCYELSLLLPVSLLHFYAFSALTFELL